MSDRTDETSQPKYGIAELAALGGVSRRTVRYYVQRGLLPAPSGTGRGKHYGEEHLERLIQVRRWQEEGKSLGDIEAGEAEPSTATCVAVADAVVSQLWVRYGVAEGVELMMRSDAGIGPAKLDRIAQAVRKVLEGE